MFERFLTQGRTDLPDFDIDFPATARDWIEGHVAERWGADSVVRVGTHVMMQNKGIIRALARTLKSFQLDLTSNPPLAEQVPVQRSSPLSALTQRPWFTA